MLGGGGPSVLAWPSVVLGLDRAGPGRSPLPSPAGCVLRRRQRAPLVVLAVLELFHLIFYEKEVALGQKVQVPLERHVPVLRRPPLDVFQTGRKKVSVNVLVIIQDYFGFNLDLIGPLGASFLLPDRFFPLKIGRGGSGGGGEAPVNGHIKQDPVTVFNSLNLAPVLRLQPLFCEPQISRNAKVVGVADDHPKIVGHSFP